MGQLAVAETNSRNALFAYGRDRRSEQDARSGQTLCCTTEATLTVQACDLRRSKRKAVLMRATLIGMDGVQQVRLKDITSEGAGIICQAPLASGADVILKRGDLFIAARVVWADGMTAGLEFYRPLTAEWHEIIAEPSQPIFR